MKIPFLKKNKADGKYQKHVEWNLSNEIKEKWYEIDIEYLKRVFDQAEKRLQETIKTADSLTDRGYKLSGIAISVATILASYVFSQDWTDCKDRVLEIAAVISLVMSGASIYFIVRLTMATRFHVLGSEPKKTLTINCISYEPDEQYRVHLFSEIESLQNRIAFNFIENDRRIKLSTKAIYWLMVIPVSPIFSQAYLSSAALLNCL